MSAFLGYLCWLSLLVGGAVLLWSTKELPCGRRRITLGVVLWIIVVWECQNVYKTAVWNAFWYDTERFMRGVLDKYPGMTHADREDIVFLAYPYPEDLGGSSAAVDKGMARLQEVSKREVVEAKPQDGTNHPAMEVPQGHTLE